MEHSDFKFPITNWHVSLSDSYGTDELYHGKSVIETIFQDSEKQLALKTYSFLLNAGAHSTRLETIRHTDNCDYHYVFGEQTELRALFQRLFPEIRVEPPKGRRSLFQKIFFGLFK